MKDLTRWNRAGLSRFEYLDGNAVTYLELLRQQLVAQFGASVDEPFDWISPAEIEPQDEVPASDETLLQRQRRISRTNERMLQTYRQHRRDWAWEITRTFARSCHILTEYANAYANEGFLGTATQWENVRRLVAMLNYHPAPPASAYTWLVFETKPDMSGKLPKGTQVKNSPANGADKVIFETLQEVDIDARLNALRPAGWNRSDSPAVDSTGNVGQSGVIGQANVSFLPAIDLQGISTVQTARLNALVSPETFKVKDFLELTPSRFPEVIPQTWVREWKAKAHLLTGYVPNANWPGLYDWPLHEITAASDAVLADLSGNSEAEVAELKRDLQVISICLDHPVFQGLHYRDLLAAELISPISVSTWWSNISKPKLSPQDEVLIVDTGGNLAEAAGVVSITEVSLEDLGDDVDPEQFDVDPPVLDIGLRAAKDQQNWFAWKKADLQLHFAPRLRKKCWLHGADVIRTTAPHGLSPDIYICWKSASGAWAYAKVIESDTWNARLETEFSMPVAGDDIYLAQTYDSELMSADQTPIGVVTDSGNAAPSASPVKPQDPPAKSEMPFNVIPPAPGSGGGGFLLPKASLPGLPSFLFPTPFLPIDLVQLAVDMLLSLGIMQIPSSEEFVLKGLPITGLPEMSLPGGLEDTPLNQAGGAILAALNAMVNDPSLDTPPSIEWPGLTEDADDSAKIEAIADVLQPLLDGAGEESIMFKKIENDLNAPGVGPLVAVLDSAEPVAKVTAPSPYYVFDGEPDKLNAGDWVMAQREEEVVALRIDRIETLQLTASTGSGKVESWNAFSVEFADLQGVYPVLSAIRYAFKGLLTPYNVNRNTSLIEGDGIELESVPDSLRLNQDVLISCGAESFQAKVIDIVGDLVKFDPMPSGCQKGDLVVYANAVLAGHGESKPEKILGSGDATKSNQSFVLEIDQVSFIPDATMASGVAADIQVQVGERTWEQVSSFDNASPVDPYYIVRMTEEGYVRITFGDGVNGRRLPTGKNNIRIGYRVGSGLAGNVPAGSLDKLVANNPLIKTFAQPQNAAGGGDLEDMASLIGNAPQTTLAMKRAVSLNDFAHLASSQSQIWQARAYRKHSAKSRRELVRVVVVPSGGVRSEPLRRDLIGFLENQAASNVSVDVGFFTPVQVSIKATVRIDFSAYLPSMVEAAVGAALQENFALLNRRLGQPLYLSEVYKIVESIEGVENSVCILNGDPDLKMIEAGTPDEVLYLDTEGVSQLVVLTREFRP